MRKQFYLLISICMVIGILTACGNKPEEKPKETSQEKTPISEVKTPEPPKYNYPLTGVTLATESKQRAVAVTISNAPEARPQSGLSQADIVFEFYAESNITRFLAIFQSEQPENIGPVRSAREYFLRTAKGMGAFYVAHGYSPPAEKMLQNGFIENINGMAYDGNLFKRSKDRVAPHNSYITFENIKAGATLVGASLEGSPPAYQFMTSAEADVLQGTPAITTTIDLKDKNFSPTYTYDPVTKKYTRSVKGTITAEKGSGTVIQLDNILILEMIHTNDREFPILRQINLETGGKGYLLQRGIAKPIEWQNVNGKITPMIGGQEAKLVPGKTWVNVIPTTPGIAGLVAF